MACKEQHARFSSEETKEHPKAQHTRKCRYSTVPRICTFRCVAFSGALCSALRGCQNTSGNATHLKTQMLVTVDYLRFWVCCVFVCVCVCFLAPVKFRGWRGGVDKQGGPGGNLTKETPQRSVVGPHRVVRFPSPVGVAVLFLCCKKHKIDRTKSSVGEVQFFSGGCLLWCMFLPQCLFMATSLSVDIWMDEEATVI